MKTALLIMVGVVWLAWVAVLLVFRRRPELRVGTACEFFYPAAALLFALLWLASTPTLPGSWFLSLYLWSAVMVGPRMPTTWPA